VQVVAFTYANSVGTMPEAPISHTNECGSGGLVIRPTSEAASGPGWELATRGRNVEGINIV